MNIIQPLAHLASLDIQRRYIINATRDEYLVPEELLDDAHSVVRHIRTQPQSVCASAVAAILALEPLLAAVIVPPNRNGMHHFIEDDTAWRAAREQSGRCLDSLGFDLVAWEHAYK